MARKQFVSSKKNAPSRAVSSKEAALAGRNGHGPTGDDSDASMDGPESVSSPISSVASSPISSSDDEGAAAAEEPTDDADAVFVPGNPVDVQVMPATVGRGKQLRFPTMISRGKESRVLHNGPDRDGSDSESYASVASDEEDDDEDRGVATEDQAPRVAIEGREGPSSPSKSGPPSCPNEADLGYPIKASRARKRHRPDSGYFTQMSTHVRDCLLSVRDTANAANVFREDVHVVFRRKLSCGTVERVQWKEATTSTPPPTAPDRRRPEEEKLEKNKAPKSKKEDRGKEKVMADMKTQKNSRSHTDTDPPVSVKKEDKPSHEKLMDDQGSSKSRSQERSSATSSSTNTNVKTDKRAPRDDDKSNSVSKDKTDPKRKMVDGEALCAKCRGPFTSEGSTTNVAKQAPVISQVEVPAAPAAGTFTISPGPQKEIAKLREMASKMNEEARALKHEGNRRGSTDSGSAGQIAQGKFYLKSSAKFFQHALILADLKQAYKDVGDNHHARTYGDFCVKTLAQTSSLIESTLRTFQSAGSSRMVALGYKLASIVHLTIYRLQHLKLFSLYSDLFTPGRSPDSRQNGSTPPIGGSSSDSQDAAVRNLLLKEMEHTLRGFEMWRRYESCKVDVLPRITNPAVMDLKQLFEDLEVELNR